MAGMPLMEYWKVGEEGKCKPVILSQDAYTGVLFAYQDQINGQSA